MRAWSGAVGNNPAPRNNPAKHSRRVPRNVVVAAAFVDFKLPYINTIVALTIATVKATFVVLYFMHVRYSTRLIWVIFAAALFWMAILFALTFSDYQTRKWDRNRTSGFVILY